METGALIGRRYRLLNKLGHGGMGELYRALDRLTGRTLALKRVTHERDEADPTPSAETLEIRRVALAQEFRLLASLRHPHIITVLDYGFDTAGFPFFTMELQEGARTIVEAGMDQPLAVQVNMLVQLLQALAYLHRRGIIHRDLKPSNVLVADDQVKVLDFGVSTARGAASGTLAGTIAFMAPELLGQEPASERSDLYAAGVIAYELFAGRRLFQAEKVSELFEMILHRPPDLSEMPNREVGEVIGQLLAKEPSARPPGARAAIEALCQAADQPIPQESVLIRESYLQAADLIGRDAELDALAAHLEELRSGRGASVILSGESGAGKTRLMEELRARALVKGLLVLRGQAEREGALPYQLWRGSARWLALIADLTELEAGVLKRIVPDLEALLQRPVADPPALGADAERERFLAVLEDLFRRVDQPIVLLLEDLQWSGSNDRAALERVRRLTAHAPLLLIATCRDEALEEMRGFMPGAEGIELGPLDKAAIADLSAAMLGPAGRHPGILKLLQREAEGNPFFLVEVMRALAHQAGGLDQVALAKLPEHVFTGGMQRILRERLRGIPESDRRLLSLAAAHGRQMDLDLLAVLEPEADIETWLMTYANRALLEVVGGSWQFAQEKLRDALLADLAEAERAELHRRIAEALERLYPDSVDLAAILALHWHLAGDAERERTYAAVAGDAAVNTGAYREAVPLLLTALGAAQAFDLEHRAHLERMLGEAYYSLGLLDEAREHLGAALRLLGWPLPAHGAALVVGVLGQVVAQAGHRLLAGFFHGRGRRRRERYLEAVRALERMLEIAHFANETLVSLYAGMRSLNLAENAGGASIELANAYANMCFAASLIPLRGAAEGYRRRALVIGRQLQEAGALGWSLFVSGYYYTCLGQWERARAELDGSQRIHAAQKNLRRIGECRSVEAYVHYFRGEFEQGASRYAELFHAARARDDLQQQVWGLNGQAMNLLRQGKFDQALAALRAAEPLLARSSDRVEQMQNHALRALAHVRLGNLQAAREQAEHTAVLIGGVQPGAPYALDAYASIVEVYTALLESSSTADEHRRYQAAGERALKPLGRFSGVFPIGLPRYWLWRGNVAWLKGNAGRAKRAWSQALDHAQRLQMPYEEAAIHAQFGGLSSLLVEERRGHLVRAVRLFKRMNAAYDWAQARLALEGLDQAGA